MKEKKVPIDNSVVGCPGKSTPEKKLTKERNSLDFGRTN
jgi:hypothetical protein